MSQEGYGISPLSKARSKGKSVRVRCYSKVLRVSSSRVRISPFCELIPLSSKLVNKVNKEGSSNLTG